MKLYNTPHCVFATRDDEHFARVPAQDFDELLCDPALLQRLELALETPNLPPPHIVLAPVGQQEVWVTGSRLRSDSPETAIRRVAASAQASAMAPSAEFPFLTAHPSAALQALLAVVLDARGKLIGYTLGTAIRSGDIIASRLPDSVPDIRCAVGPSLLIRSNPLPGDTTIQACITRKGSSTFRSESTVAAATERAAHLAADLFREHTFPKGLVLLVGTGLLAHDGISLAGGDVIAISAKPIGSLTNTVA